MSYRLVTALALVTILALSAAFGPYGIGGAFGQPTQTETPTPYPVEMGTGVPTTPAERPSTAPTSATRSPTSERVVSTTPNPDVHTTPRAPSERTPTQTVTREPGRPTQGATYPSPFFTETETETVTTHPGTENDQVYPDDYPPTVYADVIECTAVSFSTGAYFDTLEVTVAPNGTTPYETHTVESYQYDGKYGSRMAAYFEVDDRESDRIVEVRALTDSPSSPPVVYHGVYEHCRQV